MTDAEKRRAHLALSGIIGAYMSALVRGEGALATSILQLFQQQYTAWFPAVRDGYETLPSGLPTRLDVNGRWNLATRTAVVGTLYIWLNFHYGDDRAAAKVAQVGTMTADADVRNWWIEFTAQFVPLDSSAAIFQNFWRFDTIVTETEGTVDAKVGALANAAGTFVAGRAGTVISVPGSVVTAKRPPGSQSDLGLYVTVGTVTALAAGVGVLVWKRRRR